MSISCVVYRCSRQEEMYLYLRADLPPEALPENLRRLTGRLTRVMDLELTPERRLARVEVAAVRTRLAGEGWYLQLPPQGQMHGHLHDGD
jgi:hypothetical protein